MPKNVHSQKKAVQNRLKSDLVHWSLFDFVLPKKGGRTITTIHPEYCLFVCVCALIPGMETENERKEKKKKIFISNLIYVVAGYYFLYYSEHCTPYCSVWGCKYEIKVKKIIKKNMIGKNRHKFIYFFKLLFSSFIFHE